MARTKSAPRKGHGGLKESIKSGATLVLATIGMLTLTLWPIWVANDCSTDPLDVMQVMRAVYHGEGLRTLTPKASWWPFAVEEWSTPVKAYMNVQLFLIFGIIHSLTAKPSAYKMGKRYAGLSEGQYRGVYNFVSGILFVLFMGFWVPLRVTIYEFPVESALGLAPHQRYALDLFLATFFGLCALGVVASFGFPEFFGCSRKSGTKAEHSNQLHTTGIYGFVRHPMYTCQLLMCLCSTTITLDRTLMAVSLMSYLFAVGLPLEERKLIDHFGKQYEHYQEQVPALIPWNFLYRIFTGTNPNAIGDNIAERRPQRSAAVLANAVRQAEQSFTASSSSSKKRSTSRTRASTPRAPRAPRSSQSSTSRSTPGSRSRSVSRKRKPKS
eukprot:gb/GECG01009120.1/.p1 GENE.gb/GECG01009120.1/~~gb/GECG01009120.1/.p1  ORF type:complete len:383 (+),score=28.32 gb/GECG01009120.1/:1-1149(+)